VKLSQNFSQNIFLPSQHLIVPESQNSKTTLCEDGAAYCVDFDAIPMLATVDLDNEFRLDANKIDDVTIDRNLPAKLETAQAARTQACPQ
jgi:hypothetical protein